MVSRDTPPLELETAHERVHHYLESASDDVSTQDVLTATGICLQYGDSEIRRDGAAAAAALADDETRQLYTLAYDLGAASSVDDTRARVQVLGTITVIAQERPQAAFDILDEIVPRLNDPEPLVREATCAAIAWILSSYFDANAWDDLSAESRSRLDTSLEPLFAQTAPEQEDDSHKWQTSVTIDHPRRPFWGEVQAGETRREYLRWQATYALALLADLFPAQVRDRAQWLGELPFLAGRGETRGYAVDALARADADTTLREARDRARELLEETETEARGVAILSSFAMERPELLVPVAPELAVTAKNTSLDDSSRTLASKTVLLAVIHDPSDISQAVQEIVRATLTAGEDSFTGELGISTNMLARVAEAAPELVLPQASRAAGVSTSDADVADVPGADGDLEQWKSEDAWRILTDVADDSLEAVTPFIEADRLSVRLRSSTEDLPWVQRLWAQTVTLPPAESELTALLDQLHAGDGDPRKATSILLARSPAQICPAIVEHFENRSTPSKQAVRLLAAASSKHPELLLPLQETVQGWQDTVRPYDERWTYLYEIIGQLALETADERQIAKLLHLDDPNYCTRILETSVAADLVQAAPNKAIPPLLEHLSGSDAKLRRQIVKTFETPPDNYGGWSDKLYDAVLATTEAHDRQLRETAVRTLGDWLEQLDASPNDADDDRAARIREALIPRLADNDWRVRTYAIRALKSGTATDSWAAIEDRVATETAPIPRFEARRAIERR